MPAGKSLDPGFMLSGVENECSHMSHSASGDFHCKNRDIRCISDQKMLEARQPKEAFDDLQPVPIRAWNPFLREHQTALQNAVAAPPAHF